MHQDPAGLIDEGWIAIAGFGRLDEDRIILDANDPVPGDELVGLSPAVVDEDAEGFGIGLGQLEGQVAELADAVLDLAGTDGALEQAGEEEELVVLCPGGGRGYGFGRVVGLRRHLFILGRSFLKKLCERVQGGHQDYENGNAPVG